MCGCVSCVCSVGVCRGTSVAYLHLDEALGRCCVCSVCVRGDYCLVYVGWSTSVAYLRHGFVEAEDVPFNGELIGHAPREYA